MSSLHGGSPRTCKWLGWAPHLQAIKNIWKGKQPRSLGDRKRSPWLLTTYLDVPLEVRINCSDRWVSYNLLTKGIFWGERTHWSLLTNYILTSVPEHPSTRPELSILQVGFPFLWLRPSPQLFASQRYISRSSSRKALGGSTNRWRLGSRSL